MHSRHLELQNLATTELTDLEEGFGMKLRLVKFVSTTLPLRLQQTAEWTANYQLQWKRKSPDSNTRPEE